MKGRIDNKTLEVLKRKLQEKSEKDTRQKGVEDKLKKIDDGTSVMFFKKYKLVHTYKM